MTRTVISTMNALFHQSLPRSMPISSSTSAINLRASASPLNASRNLLAEMAYSNVSIFSLARTDADLSAQVYTLVAAPPFLTGLSTTCGVILICEAQYVDHVVFNDPMKKG